jgi:hypothetical protein
MTDYIPESTLGWLDHNIKDSQHMRGLVAAFGDRQSIDNLGIGIVRDSISEQLFPGINTIQTRARYLLFIPWFCQRLESERVSSADFTRRYQALEVALIDRLADSTDARGVIGIEARDRLKRFAIEIYWGGLGAYGIRHVAGSVSDYRRGLASLYRYRRADHRDDDGNVIGSLLTSWDPNIPSPPRDFYEETDFDLTEDEATYLVTSIRQAHHGTLVAQLAGADPSYFDEPDIWHLPKRAYPAPQRELIRQAQLFAVAIQPARTVYNLLLARKSDHVRASDVAAAAESELERWRIDRQELIPELDPWIAGLEGFWALADPDRSIPVPWRGVITRLIERCHAYADDIETAEALHRDIEDVERKLKGPLARLSSGRALDTWKGHAFGVGYLDYRWHSAAPILADISKALN